MGETDFKGIYSEPLLEQGDGSDLHLPRKASFAERYFRALVALLSLSLLTNVFLFTVKHREIKDGHSLYGMSILRATSFSLLVLLTFPQLVYQWTWM